MRQRITHHPTRLRRAGLPLAALGLVMVLATIATGIVTSRRQSEQQMVANLQTRGELSAGFVSTFVSQQAARQRQTAQELLARRETSASRFATIADSFGSPAAVLLDRSGRLLQVVPSDPAILGTDIAPRYAHLSAAEAGHTAVSGVVRSAVNGQPVVAVAVPFQTVAGRRVISLAYPVAQTVLAALVAHATVLRPHRVMLVDATGKVIAANPTISASTLNQADPQLAAAISGHPRGNTRIAGAEARYASVPVAGTSWHLIIAIPDNKLFASIDGSARSLPWLVFSLLAVFGLLALALFARSLTTSRRLAVASAQLARAARTDTVTDLLNRRALEECLDRAVAHARRHKESLTVLMIDLDRFKQFNDTYGHDTGDQILRLVAGTLRAVLRESDMYGRWGGDEFLAVLPGTDRAGAETVSHRLREYARTIDRLPAGVTQHITLSVGAATSADASSDELVGLADLALYRVKKARPIPVGILG